MIQPLKITFSTSKGDNVYVIKPPSVGQFYDIEVNKQLFGKGVYGAVIKTNTLNAQHAADMIDIEAHLRVLMPQEFFDDLKTESFQDLGIEDYNRIRKTYVNDFLPWWKQIQDLLKLEDDA